MSSYSTTANYANSTTAWLPLLSLVPQPYANSTAPSLVSTDIYPSRSSGIDIKRGNLYWFQQHFYLHCENL